MILFDLAIQETVTDTYAAGLWRFLPVGYLLTVLIETPVLILCLTRKLTLRQRTLCGIWLTACTYPVVVLILPMLFADGPRWQYLAAAETFAPVAECFLFWLAFRGRAVLSPAEWLTNFAAIVVANLASFGAGEVMNHFGWFGLF